MRRGWLLLISSLLLLWVMHTAADAVDLDETYEKPEPFSWGQILDSFFGTKHFGKSYALVVGIGDFEYWRNLAAPATDAQRVRDFLIHDEGFDYVITLTNRAASKQRIEELMIDMFPELVGPNDRFFFYFSGHGTQRTRGNLTIGYMPLYSSKSDAFSSMISMEDIDRWDRLLTSARQTLFMLDACFSGLAGIEIKGSSLTDKKLERLSQYAHHLITAGTENEESVAGDRWNGSLFTETFLRAVRGRADSATRDFTPDGIVSLKEMMKYVEDQIDVELNNLNRHSPIDKNLKMTPQMRDLQDNAGEFFFISRDYKNERMGNTADSTLSFGMPEHKGPDLGGPEFALLDPPLSHSTSEGIPLISVHRSEEPFLVTGRVMAPAGLLSLIVNQQPQRYYENNLFQTPVEVSQGGTHVAMVAIDRQGKRGELEFVLVPESTPGDDTVESGAPQVSAATDLGGFYALVIGNNDYQHLPSLETPINDAEAVAGLLKEKYGFEVTLLRNANRYAILSALNVLRGTLTEDDNLMIYYAGHGELDATNQRGYWLPVDAEADNTVNWISNIEVTDVLNAMAAQRALVVADSAYSGSLTLPGAGPGTLPRMSREARATWLKSVATRRSRTVLTSGGLAPVLDSAGGQHSVFAEAFLKALGENQEVIQAGELFQAISSQVRSTAHQLGFEQVPEYAAIKYAGHEAGEFLFVPRSG